MDSSRVPDSELGNGSFGMADVRSRSRVIVLVGEIIWLNVEMGADSSFPCLCDVFLIEF